ncbi:uncharacterized protein N7511_007545 [Penicillium nucicola]|uniref:uncharacterized protein n=1 Tax=Penicillium nucicola TaxID=1850975 RepID=UPI002544DB68|nr:uncharacterized protein N7511_007545 [Penicillium nucicola]KAJ5753392.1 hypothetical protein N7511_007545 [Penicillium nucicola]
MKKLPTGRRSHRKSRAGCLQCKRRRVKCDEEKPRCGNCGRHGVPCSFASPVDCNAQPDLVESPTSLESVTSSSGNADFESVHNSLPISSPIPLSTAPPSLAIFDLELLHHYVTSTCYTLSQAPAVQAVWRDQAPRVGFSTPPVLHSLLALSALHMARFDEARRVQCLDYAQKHHALAVKAIVPFVPTLASDNISALFLFSSLTCITSCAQPAGCNSFLFFEGGNLTEWARLFRGTRTVIASNRADLMKGILGPIIMNGSHLAAAHREPQALEIGRQYVWELRHVIRTECPDPAIQAIYEEALDVSAQTLSVALKPGATRRLETADIFRWLFDVSDAYLVLLGQEEPISLVIFSYWCVCIRKIDWMWWLEGLSERMMLQIYATLDPKYHDWLRWPQEFLNGDD